MSDRKVKRKEGTCDWCKEEDQKLILTFDQRNWICEDYKTCTDRAPAGSRMMM